MKCSECGVHKQNHGQHFFGCIAIKEPEFICGCQEWKPNYDDGRVEE